MEGDRFRKVLDKMRSKGVEADMLGHEYWRTLDPQTQDRWVDVLDSLQGDLGDLVANNELTIQQVRELSTVVYHTPGNDISPQATHAFDILLPEAGNGANGQLLDQAKEMDMMFLAGLTGLAQPQVQGTKSGYMPVRIERSKSTDKNK